MWFSFFLLCPCDTPINISRADLIVMTTVRSTEYSVVLSVSVERIAGEHCAGGAGVEKEYHRRAHIKYGAAGTDTEYPYSIQ